VQGSDAHAYLKIPARRKTIVDALNQSSSTIKRSAKLAEMLGDAGVTRAKLHPVYNGVDLELFRPTVDKAAARQALNLPPDHPMLLYVGNFLPVKNPQLLVQAHADVCKRLGNESPLLVMIGGGPLEHSVRQLADQLGFGKQVLLAGRKLALEVARFMQAADLVCLSSENEGVPNVILEAFASGIPVMSTNVGGISEVLNHSFLGRLIERGDLSAMSNAIRALLATPPQTDRIREHALNFSWNKAAASYATLIKEAAGS
jgi:glycosyltransferase involved in cell wall biosynthesis